MTNTENKQQVVDDKEVVAVISKAVPYSYPKCEWIAQLALKVLTDNGYIITKGNV